MKEEAIDERLRTHGTSDAELVDETPKRILEKALPGLTAALKTPSTRPLNKPGLGEMGVVIVTGGAGFLGSYVVEELAVRGYEVIVVDDFSSGSPDNLEGLRSPGPVIVKANISRTSELWGKLPRINPGDVEGVIHLAAVVNVEEARVNPWRTISVNVMGTANALEAARRLDVGAFILASSVAVYGEPRYLPIDEGLRDTIAYYIRYKP